jgi:SAM-dependent MidA family methyltransferase
VDFTAVAEAAEAAGMGVSGFTTQAHYLLDVGLEALLDQLPAEPGPAYYAQTQALKQLMLPGEMGEKFKAILLTRGLDNAVPGFRGQDFSSRL